MKRFVPIIVGALAGLALTPDAAWASSAMEDKIANVVKWVVVITVPIIGIYIFWMLHILPEKIAHKRGHPQLEAIKTLCILSLFFGGLLWPFAFIWAYSKPVMHKLAYGTDRVEYGHEEAETLTPTAVPAHEPQLVPDTQQSEIEILRQRLARLEAQMSNRPSA